MKKPFSKSIPLNIGQIIASDESFVVRTILGSCVSICMYHKRTRHAAICHAIYPGCGAKQDTRYVRPSIDEMLEYFSDARIPFSQIEVKLFGGAFTANTNKNHIEDDQNRTVYSAMQVLHEKGLKVVVADTGGPFSRELFFNFRTGEVYVRKFRISVKMIGGDHE